VIVGQGFYETSDINMMEHEMIKHLAWDLRIALFLSELDQFAARIQKNYRKGIPKRKFQPIFSASPPTAARDVPSETSTREDKLMPAPFEFCTLVAPRVFASLNSPHPRFTAISSPNSSSHKSSPPSPRLSTPPNVPDIARSGQGQTYSAACNNISPEPELIDSFGGGGVVIGLYLMRAEMGELKSRKINSVI
jgi:hypothetical protein